jgi:DNA invertase Pin-like site-specific DNA recombinase
MTTKQRKLTRTERLVGATRISKSRADETSTDTQATAIEGWCTLHHAELVEIVEDNGRSAYKKAQRYNREGPRRALQLIKAGAATGLICWKIDRVARNARDLLNLIHEIEELGGIFVSVTENIDTSNGMGRAMVTIIGALAELESAQKSERIESWQEDRRLKRKTPTGPRPFGYTRTRNELHIDKAEAKMIRDAARAVVAGQSLRSLVQRFPLTQRALRRVLTTPTTAALREIDGIFVDCSDVWEPILDRQTWEQLRTILLDDQRRTNPGGSARRHLLSGLLECGKGTCDGRFRIKTTHKAGNRYECAKCSQSVPEADTDELIEQGVKDALDAVTWKRLRRRGGAAVNTADVEKRLAELAERSVLPVTDDDYITPAEWEVMRKGIKQQLADAAAQPVELPDVSDPRREWGRLSIDERRLLITAVMPRIVVGQATPGRSYFDAERITPLAA